MQETQEIWVQSLGQEDPPEEEMKLTPVFLQGLMGYSPWDPKYSDTTEWTHTYSFTVFIHQTR